MTTTFRAGGLHHHGVTVSDVERSAKFYEEVFGAEREWEVEIAGEGVSAMTGVPDADIRIVSLRLPYGGLELFEYRNPGGRPYDRRGDDIGATHLCLEVEDIDAAHARVQELGIEASFPPVHIEEGATAGYKFFYMEDPDGLLIELLELPKG